MAAEEERTSTPCETVREEDEDQPEPTHPNQVHQNSQMLDKDLLCLQDYMLIQDMSIFRIHPDIWSGFRSKWEYMLGVWQQS